MFKIARDIKSLLALPFTSTPLRRALYAEKVAIVRQICEILVAH